MYSVRIAGGLSGQATALYNEQYDLDHRVGFAADRRSVLLGGANFALRSSSEPPSVQGAPMASTSMKKHGFRSSPQAEGPLAGRADQHLAHHCYQEETVPCIYINL